MNEYEHQNLLSLLLVSFLVGLRTYQHPCIGNRSLAPNTYGGQESCIQGFVGGHLREREHFEDLIIDDTKLLKQIFKVWDGEE